MKSFAYTKELFLGLVIGLLSTSAYCAETRNVYVQCQIEGPVYKGTLEMEPDLFKWQALGLCDEDWQREYKIPEFKLSFNGVNYVNAQATAKVIHNDKNCSTIDRYVDFSLRESTSGFGF